MNHKAFKKTSHLYSVWSIFYSGGRGEYLRLRMRHLSTYCPSPALSKFPRLLVEVCDQVRTLSKLSLYLPLTTAYVIDPSLIANLIVFVDNPKSLEASLTDIRIGLVIVLIRGLLNLSNYIFKYTLFYTLISIYSIKWLIY